MEYMGPVRLRDVEEAQQKIVKYHKENWRTREKLSFLEAEAMRSLSKILKRVIYESENPLQLKKHILQLKKLMKSFLSKAELTRRRFYEG